ncbi:hypothetical protein MYAM1_003622 [Malassezia yamatoensis]|uniref:Sphingomyelin phosphodiesterase n=1 Tax=Malassezia yamatoensis TaxID=253288 RepID=A0AAJ5YYB2_9BASI|nr:hypothetical protein MYAM1_003622 [Malassezia yamatoensis]
MPAGYGARSALDDAELQPLQDDAVWKDVRTSLKPKIWRIVRVTVFVVLALYAITICWPRKSKPVDEQVLEISPEFPTSEFPGMDFMPKNQEAEPRPVITRVSGGRFSDQLVDPVHLPTGAPSSEVVLPKPTGSVDLSKDDKQQFYTDTKHAIQTLFNSDRSSCDKCLEALRHGQRIARNAPEIVPDILIDLCKEYDYFPTTSTRNGCEGVLSAAQWGGPYTQMLSYLNVSQDSVPAQLICAKYIKGKACKKPARPTLSKAFLNDWFRGQPVAPAEVQTRSKKTGAKRDKPLRTLHVSDLHVDPRYLVGAEARCDNGQCCRVDSYNSTIWQPIASTATNRVPANISEPANYWGSYRCDPPWSLIAAGMQGISAAVQTDGPLDLGVFTGDFTTHDQQEHISRDLVMYAEQSMIDMLARHTGDASVVVALGNHDFAPSDFAAVPDLPDQSSDQLSWNYDHLASLIKSHGWGNDSVAQAIRTHYGGYSVSPRQGLRIISINSDFWYKANPMAYLKADQPDMGGVLRWLTDELQAAEQAHERAWIVAHVLSGWDGKNALEAPTNLFYHIVSRYSHTIAHIFYGHTHEDQFQLFYNSTDGDSLSVSRQTEDAVGVAFIGPSLTPLSGVQPSFRIYEVDPETYEVMDYLQYYLPLNDAQQITADNLQWKLLYRARNTYESMIQSSRTNTYRAQVPLEKASRWPASAPLNATFWAAVTDEMQARPSLLELHHVYQSRKSPQSWKCNTAECHKAKLCYMRSGSASLGRQCPKGYASVQS